MLYNAYKARGARHTSTLPVINSACLHIALIPCSPGPEPADSRPCHLCDREAKSLCLCSKVPCERPACHHPLLKHYRGCGGRKRAQQTLYILGPSHLQSRVSMPMLWHRGGSCWSLSGRSKPQRTRTRRTAKWHPWHCRLVPRPASLGSSRVQWKQQRRSQWPRIQHPFVKTPSWCSTGQSRAHLGRRLASD